MQLRLCKAWFCTEVQAPFTPQLSLLLLLLLLLLLPALTTLRDMHLPCPYIHVGPTVLPM
jgi:hypothetical protein